MSGEAVIYEIRVKGHAERTIRAAFQEFDVSIEPGVIVLIADVQDQPALHGVLAHIHTLGLELVELRRTDVVGPR